MTTPRQFGATAASDWALPRPVDESYWVVPGRLLAGAHPGSRSRAQAMERLRRFLDAGVTCFIDLTEAAETAAYETLLPFEAPNGRRIEYLREPIPDHGVPSNRETMQRILALLDGSLDAGHVVYLHCRAGIGRSATAVGCWLAERSGSGAQALDELARYWQPAAQSRLFPSVPETEEQAEYVRQWQPSAGPRSASSARAFPVDDLDYGQRARGAWFGLALGDALGAAHARKADPGAPLAWTQHTALALCLAESLFAKDRCDARDQMESYLLWQRQGFCASRGEPGEAEITADVAKAIATYLWRGIPMAGPHDPRDRAATSLPRVLAAAMFAWGDPARAVQLGAECARTTHQSPTILDACRVQAAMIVCALQGRPADSWLVGLPSPSDDCWSRPLHGTVAAVVGAGSPVSPPGLGNVLRVLTEVRRITRVSAGFEDAIAEACRAGRKEAPLYAALVGTLMGLCLGHDRLPAARIARLAGVERIAATADRFLERGPSPRVPA
ncbi:MAG TPA: ADP-ribosylglycohydrolase family protein [Steroidobacteraceae bacterium]